jgi:peptide/nickel transport system ATP-binding protein
MYQGRIVEHGPAEAVLGSPEHAYTRRLLAAVPVPGTRIDGTEPDDDVLVGDGGLADDEVTGRPGAPAVT